MSQILYVYQEDQVVKVYERKKQMKCISIPLMQFLDMLCFKSGHHRLSKQKFSRQLLRIKNKIPLYIHHSCILFPTTGTKDPQCIWVNYYYITRVYQDLHGCAHVCLNDSVDVNLYISMRSLRVQLNRCKRICEFIEYV